MSSPREDDALSWGGDDDPTLEVGARVDPEPAADHGLPEGYTAVGRGSAAREYDTVGRDADAEPLPVDTAADAVTDADLPAPMSSAVLVTLGIIAGIYLLYTIGWIVGGLRLADTARFLVSPVGYQASLWLAITAPALWFVTVFVLTRAARAWVRILWLIGGLALLLPWPFVMVGAVGQ